MRTVGRRTLVGLAACAAYRRPLAPARAAAPTLVPVALALVITGFLTPAEQYRSYVGLLAELGIATITFNDGSTLRAACPLGTGAARALAAVEAEAERLGLSASTPLVLVGHSRGAKECVLAAAQSTRPIAAFCLYDPVDSTVFEPDSTLPILSALKVPSLVLGSGVGFGDCAPLNSNFAAFWDTLSAAKAPRLLGFMRCTGHTQFLDDRGNMLDVCSAGDDDDAAIHEVALAATAAFLSAYVPGVRARLTALHKMGRVGSGLTSASWVLLAEACESVASIVPLLESRRFRAAVEWRTGDLRPLAPAPVPRAASQIALGHRRPSLDRAQ
ncbi:hypothetical protein T492DRAFT_1087351 [Pavlovales sp. CCMP2436]|nr:hypothetical protein T492DRAFT_1087351 [Pavlovales sp. CCMP2436]